MQRADADRLQRNRVAIVADLDVHTVLDWLIQNRIITSEDSQLIISIPTSQGRARSLLDILPTRGPSAFGVFVQALRQAGYDWLVDILTNQ